MSLISYYVTHLGVRNRLVYSWDFEGKRRCDSKIAHAMVYLGCTSEEYHQYLGELLAAMATSTGVIASFANHGQWHIDHIRPCASFNLENEIERHMCFHYTNLQPLWAFDNVSKSDSYDPFTFHRNWIIDHWE
jgi:hypothetical protein